MQVAIKRIGIPLVIATAVAVLGLSAALTPQSASAASTRSDLYSVAAVGRFCERAQQIIVDLPQWAVVVSHTDLNAFVGSSSAPYEGTNLSAYNGKGSLGTSLPLTVQQLVTYREVPSNNWEMPVVISCKMKDAESINHYFGEIWEPYGIAAVQRDCKYVNQVVVADVYGSLTASERRYLRHQQSSIVYDNDQMAGAGPSWVYPLPEPPPVATIGNDGRLHIKGYAIQVPRSNTDPNVGADKKGVYYCHLPAPEYVRALVTGQIPGPFLPQE